MAVNLVDLESMSSMPSVLPELRTPALTPPLTPPPSPPPVLVAEPAPSCSAAAIDHSPSYWVRRRREQELIARALMEDAPH